MIRTSSITRPQFASTEFVYFKARLRAVCSSMHWPRPERSVNSKLIGYVVMPDHAHLIINPLNQDIGVVMRRLKSTSARLILDWLRESNYLSSLRKLALSVPQARSHTHSLWQKDFSSIDLWSPRFIRQKLNYIHLNPVRAGLCDHPAEWKWSSYRASLPHEPGSVPIEIDWRGYWKEEELASLAKTAGNARL